MPRATSPDRADRSQRRTSLQQERSRATKRMLVQAAMALWRTNGYSSTTVADICTAAGVSKALFYFYFPRKEDVLFEVGVLSTRSARRTADVLLARQYQVMPVIAAALADLERSMARNPPELIIATILEGYRYEHRILAGNEPLEDGEAAEGGMFTALFDRAKRDGKLPAHVDVTHLAYLAHTLVSEGARHWAAGAFGDRSFAEVVGADIETLLAGVSRERT
ncbi:TetR/AcrR family transcriptional regulator [Mycolicibacterium baixiangningiae]|uniref:TetR/AcrR family transcriptional regulator n=1 Tax=Mycolicibacterium baixiangningiae TaxID=2761578 RepID=UPI0018672FC8|nr:TetR/AcrR family transcriptional regulator [Mycolicibacterium baixiangningiae]